MKHLPIHSLLSRCLALCLGALCCLFTACAPAEEAVLTLGHDSVSVPMYRLWLSRVKGAYADVEDDTWDEVAENGMTNNEILTSYVVENAKTILSAHHLFRTLGLKLPAESAEAIDAAMRDMLTERAGGSKSELNALLGVYGVNYNILKRIYTWESELSYLETYLYGENGCEPITQDVRDAYYREHYVRIEQIFLYTAHQPVTGEDGSYQYDADGHVITREFTAAEQIAKQDTADAIVARLAEGADFEELMTAYNEDTAAVSYPGGYYFTQTSPYIAEVIEAAFALEEGAYTRITSDYGIHILRRLPLEENGYAVSENGDFFSDFETNLVTQVFTERLHEYTDAITVNEAPLARYDVRSSSANSFY